MTSPQTSTTEVIANIMATTAIRDDPNLTAEIHPTAAEVNAPTTMQQEALPATIPPDENKEMEISVENAEEDPSQQASRRLADIVMTPAPVHDGLPHFDIANFVPDLEQGLVGQDLPPPADAAIPQLNNDTLPSDFEFTDQAGLAALMAMGQMGFQSSYRSDLARQVEAALTLPYTIPGQDGGWENPEEPELPTDRLVGYAKLIFEDGEFYMNTHSIKLGRDTLAQKSAQRREKDEEKQKRETEERIKKGESSAPRTPVQIKREHISYSMSLYSEKSGILREGNDSDGEARARRRQRKKLSKKSKSTGSSHELSRRNSLAQPPPPPKTHIYEPQYPDRVKEEAAAPVDPAALRPDPNECPLIPLHPSGNAPAAAYKSISREHVKIAYNFNKAIFEMHVYGRNGAFVDDVYHPIHSVVELKSGNVLQIGQVPLEFVLPDGIIADSNEQYSTGGKEMSYDFEDVKRDGVPDDSSPELVSDEELGVENGDEEEDEMDAEGEDEMEEEEEGVEMSDLDDSGIQGDEEDVREVEQELQTQAVVNKKRGPGRPPKDGIMSQREKQLAKKAALENQKAGKAGKTISLPISAPSSGEKEGGKEKKPVGRPRKHERPDPTEPEKPKRKYTKRKPKELKEGDAKEGEEGEEPVKEKKEKKVKPPRSPSPTFVESELSPEQLQKPSANYVTLIYEALSNSKEGKLGLPQIYRAIQRKYPYFVLKVGTLGWQSSVRHNLSQHHAFKKCERDGKGWLWGIEPGVSIEKEKRKRTPPPPQMGMHQQIYPGQHPYMGPPGHPYPPHMMGPPGYGPPPHMMQGPRPGLPHQYMPSPHMNGQYQPQYPQPPTNIAPGFAASIAPQLVGKSTYSSPYASNPPPAPASSPPAAPAAPPVEQKAASEQQPITNGPPPSSGAQAPSGSQDTADLPQTQALQVQSSQNQSQPQNQAGQNPPAQDLPQSHTQPPQNPTPPSQPQQGSSYSSSAAQQPSPKPVKITPAISQLLPQHSPKLITSVETFKKAMIGQLIQKHDQGEEIVNSAVNQVLGYTNQSSLPGNELEEGIINALRSFLEKIGHSVELGIAGSAQANGTLTPSTNQEQTQQSNATSTPQPPKLTGSDKLTPTVMRPTFTGQGMSRPSIARPSMGTPGMKRADSGTGSGSPARQSSETGQVTGQKRALEMDDADENRDAKRLNGSSTPQTPQVKVG